jgi:peptide chain release factor 1
MELPSNFWDNIRTRHQDLSTQVSSGSLDNNKRHVIQKELSLLSTLLSKHNELNTLQQQLADIEKQEQDNKDPEFGQLLSEEKQDIAGRITREQEALERIMFPPNELDNRSVFLEIRAGAGGQEASLFAADLLRMYTNYALKHQWRTSIVSQSETDLGGVREVVLHIEGKDVYGYLKFESGVHRVQRVPATETQGRVHTSTATVAVLPEAEEVDISINPTDLRIDVYRSGGAGGQHVNTTDSAVRITHIPSGVVVTCQDERSQHKNKAKALKMLQSRLLVAQQEKNDAELSKQRKEQVGTGMRAEKVRTYNFPQNRVTDHQVDVTLKKLDYVIEGDLDEIINALRAQEQAERRKRPFTLST